MHLVGFIRQQNLYDIYLLLCIQYWTPDDGQETCPKHVEFYSKNNFEKLVHLVGFIVRMIHTNSVTVTIQFTFCSALGLYGAFWQHNNDNPTLYELQN